MRKFILCTILVMLIFVWTCPPGLTDDWVKVRPGERTWVDTSHYEWLRRWVDTSHWELWWGWFWVSSGYWAYYWDWYVDGLIWLDNGWDIVPYVGYYGWPYSEWRGDRIFYWWVNYEWWNVGSPGRPRYRWVAVWAAAEYWIAWYRVWYWVNTSHWEWRPYWAWVGSGYWEQYLAWITSGYWAEPLHGTVTVKKEPPYVFTRWHFLTSDGRQHSSSDERAHLNLTLTFTCDRPIKSYEVYADVERYDKDKTRHRTSLEQGTIIPSSPNGTIQAKGEYEYAGAGTHYLVLTGEDGSRAVVYFDIPVNGFTGINIDKNGTVLPAEEFTKSLQDSGTVSF